jgi:hypothetical protein
VFYLPQYKIAELILNIACDNTEMLGKLEEYSVDNHEKSDLELIFKCSDFIEVPEGSIISDENIKWIKKPQGQNGYYLYTTEKTHGSLLCLVDVDNEWRKGIITYINNENKSEAENYKTQTAVYAHILMGIVYRYYLLHNDGIVIHSSTLQYKGKGIMFSAPSGTGKSTHVKLWETHIGDGVSVLNDDTPAVRLIDGKPIVYGTPWSGSSLINKNSSAPLTAIVLLEQSPINCITKLSVQEALLKLMPRTFLPYFDEDMMRKAFVVFEKIINSVPVYSLKCRPDKEAVEMVYKCVV